MSKSKRPARSNYLGLRITVTQLPEQPTALVNLSTKAAHGRWDDWSLLYPSLRVPLREVRDHRDILRVIVDAVQDLIDLDTENA